MSKIDVNDLHRAGRLPTDPFAGAVPFSKPAPAAESDEGSPVVDLRAAVNNAWTALCERLRSNRRFAGEPSGYLVLDKAIDGFQPGNFYVIGGRTGVGKSILGLNLAISMARDNMPVLYITLEMPTEQQAIRALVAWTRTEQKRIKNKTLTEDDTTRIVAEIPGLCKLPVLFDDRQGRTIEAIGKTIACIQKRLASKGTKLGMVVIDHMLLVKATNPSSPRRTQVEHVANTCKELAITNKVAIVALTQLNRESEGRNVKDRRPVVSDIQESGAIEQAADGVILMYREDYYRPNQKDHDHILELHLSKLRNESAHMVRLYFDGSRSRIDNLGEDLKNDEKEREQQTK
jgi:replicative DNA helicase